jgi:hypothetical protein
MKTNRLAKFVLFALCAVVVVSCGKKKNNEPAPVANPYPGYPGYNPGSNPYANLPSTVEIYRGQVRCFNDRGQEVGCSGNIPQPNAQCILEVLVTNGQSYSSVNCIQQQYMGTGGGGGQYPYYPY